MSLPIVEPSEVARIAELLTGSAASGPWEEQPLGEASAVASATMGLRRVRTSDWSAVVKLIGHRQGGHPNWQAGLEVDHWYYWRREALAYGSGLIGSFGGGLRGPRCYQVVERADGTVALWLEDLAATSPATSWVLPHYGPASRHLGRAQGAFLDRRPLPDVPWLSRNWLRAYLSQRDTDNDLLHDAAAWDEPIIRRHVSDALAGPLVQLRRDQQWLLGVIDRLPRTVCHLDLHPANLFGDDSGTVAIDWSFIGIGALGEDAGNLVADAVLDFHVPPDQIALLFEVVRNGYAAGLADIGWNGPPYLVDLAMTATVAAKYAWIGPAILRAALEHRTTLNGRPIEDAVERWSPVVPFVLWCAHRARQLEQLAGLADG